MRLLLLVPICLVLSSCLFDSNRTMKLDQRESLAQNAQVASSANTTIEQPMAQPVEVAITVGSNVAMAEGAVTVAIDRIIPPPMATIKAEEKVKSEEKVDQKVATKQEEKVSNPFTLLLWGMGALLILITSFLAWLWIKNTLVGRLATKSLEGGERALDSVIDLIETKRKANLDPVKDQHLRDLEEEVRGKHTSLLKKKGKPIHEG